MLILTRAEKEKLISAIAVIGNVQATGADKTAAWELLHEANDAYCAEQKRY